MLTGTELPAGLLDEIKDYLDITWDDETTDRKITGLIVLGMAYLDGKRGEPADYTVPGLPRALLNDYVRYGRDNALDVFENNYQSLLLSMQHVRQVTSYVESTAPTE